MTNTLWGCVDSDWAGGYRHTSFTQGMSSCLMAELYHGNPADRTPCLYPPASEAEFAVAASQCVQEVLYLCEILRDFHQTQQPPTLVYEDNLACIAMSENPVRRKYSRHIDIRRYLIRELVAGGILKLVPLRTHLMMADALTKSLPTPAHAKHRAVMMGHTPFSARVFQFQAG